MPKAGPDVNKTLQSPLQTASKKFPLSSFGGCSLVSVLVWHVWHMPACPQHQPEKKYFFIYDKELPHRGQPPCHGGGGLHQWPERFLKSGGQELTKSWPNPWELTAARYQCFCAGFGFTADYGFIAVYLRIHSCLRLYSRYL